MPSTITTPAVQEIPLGRIKPNPENPRGFILPIAVENLAASIKAIGLNNPIKVVPLPDGDYLLISGHIRLAAAQKLGWVGIPAQVLEITPEQAENQAELDNSGEPMHWLDWNIIIERRLQAASEPTQQMVADALGKSQKTISRAKSLMACLSPVAREAIYTQCINLGVSEGISERAVVALADLKDPQKVEKALKVAIEKDMTEVQAKKLVEWVKVGNEPESFGQAPAKPHIQGSQGQPQKSTPTHSPSKGVPAVAGDNGGAQGDFMTHVGAMMAQHELTRKLHLPTGILNRLFPWVANLFHKTRGHVQGFGIKNQLFATFLTLLIFLFVGSTLIGWAKRAIGWVVHAAIHLSTGPQASGQGLV
ncbi:MAG TPA: ParB/RepB/Spo0J family partition protein, partial [bacterium]|nr:ParB/RepB/Spo0J family partition protein [bacterium]